MKIVSRDELAKMPNGTVFSYLNGGYTIEGFEIITGRYDDGNDGFNGTLSLEPSFNWDNDSSERITNWETIDTAHYDFNEDSLFVVYNKNEIQEIIQWLKWAIGEDNAPDMNKYFYKDQVLSQREASKYTNGYGLWWG